jgi:hypothetical protein
MAGTGGAVKLPDQLYIGTHGSLGSEPDQVPHLELGGFSDLPAAGDVLSWSGDRTLTLVGWHVLTHRRTDARYQVMSQPPPEHAAVGHFERSRWTDEAWEQIDRLARQTDAQAVVLQTPVSFKASTEHATRFENFVAHGMRPGLAICWEWAPGSWPEARALELCDRIGAVPVIDPIEGPIPDGELIYLRVRGGRNGKRRFKDDDLKKIALEARDRIGWVVFSNASAGVDADRLLQMV